jgi:hypothetical protein
MDQSDAIKQLEAGRAILGPILAAHGFIWVSGSRGHGSGGPFDSGEYVRGDRRLELHFRYSLGLVTYHIGEISISHQDYMRHTGRRALAQYPSVSTDALDGFRDLAHDLSNFGDDFFSGDGSSFKDAALKAKAYWSLPGFRRLEAK